MRCSDVTAWGTTHPKGDVSRQNPTGDGGKPPGHHGVELRFCHQCKEGADHDGSLRLQETDRESLDKILFFIFQKKSWSFFDQQVIKFISNTTNKQKDFLQII